MFDIRCKVWDTKENRFCCPEYYFIDPWDSSIWERNIDDSAERDNEKRYILTPWTGLKGRNKLNKEVGIFELDVVRFGWNPFLNEPSNILIFESPVIYYAGWGCFTMKLSKKNQKRKQLDLFQDNGIDEVHVALGSPILHGSGVKIIGNGLENPELLEQKLSNEK